MERLKLAFFTVCLVYNFTEATFKMMAPVWITFLWAAMATPAHRAGSFRGESAAEAADDAYALEA